VTTPTGTPNTCTSEPSYKPTVESNSASTWTLLASRTFLTTTTAATAISSAARLPSVCTVRELVCRLPSVADRPARCHCLSTARPVCPACARYGISFAASLPWRTVTPDVIFYDRHGYFFTVFSNRLEQPADIGVDPAAVTGRRRQHAIVRTEFLHRLVQMLLVS